MNLAASVPIPPDLIAQHARSSAGRAWLASLPDLVHSRLECWQLELDLPAGALPWSGRGGLVIPVRQPDGTPAAVKMAFPDEEARVERHALALWRGRGAVALLASDAGTCAMLLERLDDRRSLATVPMDHAVEAWAGLVPQLGIRPDTRPLWQEFEHIAARAEQWSDDLPADWEQLGRPFPRWLLEAALAGMPDPGGSGKALGAGCPGTYRPALPQHPGPAPHDSGWAKPGRAGCGRGGAGSRQVCRHQSAANDR